MTLKLPNRYEVVCEAFFKNLYGEPFALTKGQQDIFHCIYSPTITRAAIKATTQYGKSEVTAMAIVYTMISRKEKILIIAPSAKQANIIMGKVIDHFFDNPVLTSMLEADQQLDKLKQERSKKRLVTRNGSEVMLLTAEARNVKKQATSLMGFGATIVVVDESSLIPDEMFSKILRMVGGVKNGKLVQLSNPFEKNHFWRALESDRYVSISIDYKQALAEGRLTQEFLDEAREDMTDLDFMIFYECKFPDGGADNVVLPEAWILNAIDQKGLEGDSNSAGLDVARFGKDSSVFALRNGGHIRLFTIDQMDTMAVVGWSSDLIDEHDVEMTNVDVVGIGAGVYDRLEELGYEVNAVNVGSKPMGDDAERFFNLRSQLFWNLRKLFKPDKNGRSQVSIPNDKELIQELKVLTYKYSSEKKIRVISKDDIKLSLNRSPDKADAVALAFYNLTGDDIDLIII